MLTYSNAVPSIPSDPFYLARQPILGRDLEPIAFELLFRAAPGQDEMPTVPNMAATAAVISHASQLGLEQVVGEQLAFFNVDEAVLMSDFVRFLPCDKVILEILETVQPTPRVLSRIVELKAQGFRFALDDVIDQSALVKACLELVDVVKFDLRGIRSEQLAALVQLLRGDGHLLLAEKVETEKEFKRCLDLGFDCFQGYYFAAPTLLSGEKIDPPAMVLLRLLNLVRADAPFSAIEDAVAHNRPLSRNLLRLTNSDPTGGADNAIDSIPQALRRLGRSRLQRWLEILLAAVPASKDPGTGVGCSSVCRQPAQQQSGQA